jgi:hypothetical protein
MELAARNAGGPAANSMINEARRGGAGCGEDDTEKFLATHMKGKGDTKCE